MFESNRIEYIKLIENYEVDTLDKLDELLRKLDTMIFPVIINSTVMIEIVEKEITNQPTLVNKLKEDILRVESRQKEGNIR